MWSQSDLMIAFRYIKVDKIKIVNSDKLSIKKSLNEIFNKKDFNIEYV